MSYRLCRLLARGIVIPLASSQHNLYDIYLLLCILWSTPDDGQRNCPKHVELYFKNKFEKLVHLVGFIIKIYHDARSSACQIYHDARSSACQICLVPFACNYVSSNQVVIVIVFVVVCLFVYLFIYLLSNTSLEQSCQFYTHASSFCIELSLEHVVMPCNLVDIYKSVIGVLCHHLLGQRVSCMEKKCYRCRRGRSTTIR
jgi:hypothetical protein